MFFRYICSNGTRIAHYDDPVTGREESVDMSIRAERAPEPPAAPPPKRPPPSDRTLLTDAEDKRIEAIGAVFRCPYP